MGNAVAKKYDVSPDHTATAGHLQQWKIYSAKLKDPNLTVVSPSLISQSSQYVSVWSFDKTEFTTPTKPRVGNLNNNSSIDKAIIEQIYALMRKDMITMKELSSANCNSIVKVVEVLEDTRSNLTFVTESILCSLADLLGSFKFIPNGIATHAKFFEGNDTLSEMEIVNGMQSILGGLQFLHTIQKKLHLNLTPESIVITTKGKWKLCNFSFSLLLQTNSNNTSDFSSPSPYFLKMNTSLVNSNSGSYNIIKLEPDLSYAAPECSEGGYNPPLIRYLTPAADIFSFGRLMYEILRYNLLLNQRERINFHPIVPLTNSNDILQHCSYMSQLFPTSSNLNTLSNTSLVNYEFLSTGLDHIIKGMLQNSISNRMEISSIQNHSYFITGDNKIFYTLELLKNKDSVQQKLELKNLLSNYNIKNLPLRVIKYHLLPLLNQLIFNNITLIDVIIKYYKIISKIFSKEIIFNELNQIFHHILNMKSLDLGFINTILNNYKFFYDSFYFPYNPNSISINTTSTPNVNEDENSKFHFFQKNFTNFIINTLIKLSLDLINNATTASSSSVTNFDNFKSTDYLLVYNKIFKILNNNLIINSFTNTNYNELLLTEICKEFCNKSFNNNMYNSSSNTQYNSSFNLQNFNFTDIKILFIYTSTIYFNKISIKFLIENVLPSLKFILDYNNNTFTNIQPPNSNLITSISTSFSTNNNSISNYSSLLSLSILGAYDKISIILGSDYIANLILPTILPLMVDRKMDEKQFKIILNLVKSLVNTITLTRTNELRISNLSLNYNEKDTERDNLNPFYYPLQLLESIIIIDEDNEFSQDNKNDINISNYSGTLSKIKKYNDDDDEPPPVPLTPAPSLPPVGIYIRPPSPSSIPPPPPSSFAPHASSSSVFTTSSSLPTPSEADLDLFLKPSSSSTPSTLNYQSNSVTTSGSNANSNYMSWFSKPKQGTTSATAEPSYQPTLNQPITNPEIDIKSSIDIDMDDFLSSFNKPSSTPISSNSISQPTQANYNNQYNQSSITNSIISPISSSPSTSGKINHPSISNPYFQPTNQQNTSTVGYQPPLNLLQNQAYQQQPYGNQSSFNGQMYPPQYHTSSQQIPPNGQIQSQQNFQGQFQQYPPQNYQNFQQGINRPNSNTKSGFDFLN